MKPTDGKRTADRARKRPRFSKIIIAAVLMSVAIFTVAMVIVFLRTGAVPDSLVTSFFAFSGGEAGALGLIRFGKAKYSDGADSGAAG